MPAAERRDQLLDVLARLILDEGYASVSIDRVAREAGIARTVVYAQFDNLAGMHTALADRNERRIFAQVSGVLPDIAADDDPDVMASAAFAAFLGVVADDPTTWRLALLPRDGAPIALRDRVIQGRATILALLTPVCAAGLERRGGPADMDPEILAHLILAGAEEAGRMVLESPDAGTEARLATFVQTALAALRP